MPFAAINTLRLSIVGALLIIIPKLDTSALTNGFLELFLMGRIPGTDTFIGFEAFFAGIICAIWLVIVYNFTLDATIKIQKELKSVTVSQSELEEVAL